MKEKELLPCPTVLEQQLILLDTCTVVILGADEYLLKE